LFGDTVGPPVYLTVDVTVEVSYTAWNACPVTPELIHRTSAAPPSKPMRGM
jgi:hypothetical protein